MYDICAVNDSKKRKYLPKWTCIENRPPIIYLFIYLFIY